MTYGLQCFNASTGELTLSSEAYTMGYLGKATFVSSHGWTGSTNSSFAGRSTWQFTNAGPIVCAIGLKSSGQDGAVIESVSQSGSTWTIIVWDMSTASEGPSGGGTYAAQNTNSDIYVFGIPASLPAYGAAFYNASSVLTGDLSRQPLSPVARISMGTNVMSTTIPTVVKPAIIGYPNTSHTRSSGGHGGSLPWINTFYFGAWQWLGGTTLLRGDYLNEYDNDDGGITEETHHDPCTAILIEANGLT